MDKRAAKAKEIVGAVTADRRVEAEGRAEQAEAEPDEQAVAVEEHKVRVEHGDVNEDEPRRADAAGRNVHASSRSSEPRQKSR